MSYIPRIGLEIHAELKTRTKMFCRNLNDPDEKHPNINVCPICMGHPGTLPVINEDAVKKVLCVGKALKGKLAEYSQFDRKNYFYPDLPKGYQISQFKYPLVEGGELRGVKITRIHLEEDTGSLAHRDGKSLVDFNRAGVPLMELVTEPVIENSVQAREFAEELQLILRYLEVSDADMEKGQMRIEANISVSKKEDGEKLGTKVEIKNLNSFKTVERAIEYEIKRQTEVLESGEKVKQETRGWDEVKQKTFSQREKEGSHDYRYFPEPDLPSLLIFSSEKIVQRRASAEVPMEEERRRMEIFNTSELVAPELPQEKRERFKKEFKLKNEQIEILVRDKKLSDYFEQVASELKDLPKINLAANYLLSDLMSLTKEAMSSISELLISSENFSELISMTAEGKISSRVAKDLLKEMFQTGINPTVAVRERGLEQDSGEDMLKKLAEEIIESNKRAADDYREGKISAMEVLVGQGMKKSKGSINPGILREILIKLLK